MGSQTHDAPLALREDVIRPEWIDYNGHMNVAYYVLAFDYATDDFLLYIGLDPETRSEHHLTTFAVEAHVTYQRELREGDRIRFTTQLLGWDRKRVHYFHRMYHAGEGYLAATLEQLSLTVDTRTRRVTTMPDSMVDTLSALHQSHAALGQPEEAGSTIRVRTA